MASCSELGRGLLALALFLFAPLADARVPTCVQVEAPGDRVALEKLVRHELERHTSHAWVESGCEARLSIELIVIDPSLGGGRFLTGWLDGEVPHRVEVASGGLAPALEELLTVVLHNDPRRLRGPEEQTDVFASGVRALRVHGQTYFGVEAFQLGAWVGGRGESIPGLAAFVRREVGSVHVAVRFGGAHDFAERSELRLTTQVIAEIEAALYSSRIADTAAFAALELGYEYQRFAGPAPLIGPSEHASASASGFSPGLRLGVELFRTTRTRALLFFSARAPTFVSRDSEGGVMNQWTPTLALGGAVAF